MTSDSHVAEQILRGRRNQTDDLPPVVRRARSDAGVLRYLVDATASSCAKEAARAAWIVREVSEQEPALLLPLRGRLVKNAVDAGAWEVRDMLCRIIPRLVWTTGQQRTIVQFLRRSVTDESRIVQAWSLDALVRLAEGKPSLLPEVLVLLSRALGSPFPAVRARAALLIRDRGRLG